MAYVECLGEFSSEKYTVRDPIESYISRSTLYYYAPCNIFAFNILGSRQLENVGQDRQP